MGPGARTADLATVAAAYGSRASAYIELFDGAELAAPEDRDLISSWAAELGGPVLDAGCGPGHWSAFLQASGLAVEGVDATPEFVRHASAAHPGIRFTVADLRGLALAEQSLGGVLAWYSLIHSDPDEVPGVLETFARALTPGGSLLIGFFPGAHLEPFDHRVVTAWTWPMDRMTEALEAAGLTVMSTQERPAPNGRRNAAVVARRTPTIAG